MTAREAPSAEQTITLLTTSVEHLTETCKSLLQASKINSDTITALNLRVSELERRVDVLCPRRTYGD